LYGVSFSVSPGQKTSIPASTTPIQTLIVTIIPGDFAAGRKVSSGVILVCTTSNSPKSPDYPKPMNVVSLGDISSHGHLWELDCPDDPPHLGACPSISPPFATHLLK
jgi:hypothetical protein